MPSYDLASLGAEGFEELCATLTSRRLETDIVERYGRSGQRQMGVDIIAGKPFSSQKVAIECKCVARVTPALVTKTLNKFWSYHSVWKTRGVDRFIVCFAADIRDVKCLDLLLGWCGKLGSVGISFEFWSGSTIHRMLRYSDEFSPVAPQRCVEAPLDHFTPESRERLSPLLKSHLAPLVRNLYASDSGAIVARTMSEWSQVPVTGVPDAFASLKIILRLISSEQILGDWRLRRVVANCLGDILSDSSYSSENRTIADELFEICLGESRTQVILAMAVTGRRGALSRVPISVMSRLTASRHPQVHWQFARKRFSMSELPFSQRITRDVRDIPDAWVRRRFMLTLFQREEMPERDLRELMEFVRDDAESDSYALSFHQALTEWSRRHRGLSVGSTSLSGTSDLRARIKSLPDLRPDRYSEFAHWMDFACIQLDSELSGGAHVLEASGRGEGRYSLIRKWIGSALNHIARETCRAFIDALLTTSDEGIRWAVAAELSTWLPFIPQSDQIFVLGKFLGDPHPWVVREALSRLTEQTEFVDNTVALHLLRDAVRGISMASAQGWDAAELVPTFLQFLAKFPLVATSEPWLMHTLLVDNLAAIPIRGSGCGR